MNPFRIIILSLLSASLLLMLYIVGILIPERQTEYAQYQSTVQMNHFNARNEAHEARLNQMTSQSATSTVSTILDDVKASDLKREAALAEAEERNIITLAQAKEEQALAQAQATQAAAEKEKAQQTSQGFEVIGEISSYDANWASLIIKPYNGAIISEGLRIAVMQQQGIICEALIDGMDEPSGQYMASMMPGKIGNSDPKPPVAGDKVIVSPFASSKDIRQESDSNSQTGPTATQGVLPELDATLVPIL